MNSTLNALRTSGPSTHVRWFDKKLHRNIEMLRTSSWPESEEVSYAAAMLVDGGIMRLIDVRTRENRITNLGSYEGSTVSEAISARHLRVTFRKSGDSRNCPIKI